MFVFGPFQFDPMRRLLIHGGETVRLTEKVAQLLSVFVESPGDVVKKEALIERVWPSTSVAPGNLTFQINQLRQALDDSAKESRYIQTVPGIGYRFVASVYRAPQPDVNSDLPMASCPVPAPLAPGTSWRQPTVFAASAAMASMLVWAAAAMAMRSHAGYAPRIVGSIQLTHDRTPKDVSSLLIADARNVYFWRTHPPSPRRVPVQGGETETAPMFAPASEFGEHLVDISADGSRYLGLRFTTRERAELWTFGPGDTPQHVGGVVANAASWSPDARRIVFASDSAFWIAERDGTSPRLLFRAGSAVGCVRWSPDGRILRFTRPNPRNRVYSLLWEIYADGSNPHVLFPGWESHDQGCGAWTHDGRGFVFDAVDTTDVAQAGTPAPQGRHDLWYLANGEYRPTPLTAGPMSFSAAMPSADGRTIYAVGVHEEAELVRFDAALHDFVPYLGGLSARWINYSRDGQRIVYVQHPDGTIWQSNLDGTDRHQLTFAPFVAEAIALSPDGRWIGIRGGVAGQGPKVYLMPADGGTPLPITSQDVAQGIPTWSADSRRIAFGDVPAQYEQPTGSEVLHTYDVTTHDLSVITGSEHLWSARWSPRGRFLAALTIKGQQLRIRDMQSGEWRTFADDHIEEMAWSADEKFIYHTNDGGPKYLARVRVSDGQVQRLTEPNEFATTTPHWMWAGLSFDGTPIVLRKAAPTEIYALKVERR